MADLLGHVRSAWRYPVSSTGGERLATLEATAEGLAGDRRFALVDAASGQTAIPERERRWHPTPLLRSRLNAAGRAEVMLPGHETAACETALSGHFGFPVRLASYADGARHRYRPAHLHLLTAASVRALQLEVPGSDLDPARFRPNLVIDTLPGFSGMVEQEWIGREIAVGPVRLAVNKPCGRCSFTSLPQAGLELDREILRALIRRHGRQFGVLCHALTPGLMTEGDAVMLL